MKIAIDISQIVYEGSGVANYTKELVSSLLKADRKNEYLLFGLSLRRLHILEEYYKKIRSLNQQVTARFLPIPQTFANFWWNRIHKFRIDSILGEKIDIFHSSDWIQPLTSAKKVTTVHDLITLRYPETSHPYIIETQKRRLHWVKREVDIVFADSQATKNDLTDILHFNANKIKVVYPGLKDIYKPIGEEDKLRIKQKYGLNDSYLLTVGTMEPRKNIRNSILAFERFLHHNLISSRKKPVELVIVGKVGWGEKYKSTRLIKILGYVAEKDMPALYGAASVFLYPSFYEGFGLPVIEAMACGLPVITSNCGSLKEVAGEAALFVDPLAPEDLAVKMTQIFVDNKLKEELIKKGIENAKRFNWEKTAKEVIKLYEEIQ